jgi:hypothetical protein
VGLFGSLESWARRLGIRRRDAAQKKLATGPKANRARQTVTVNGNRICRFEEFEPRMLLAGAAVFDPLNVGATFTEGDTGTDSAGDTFEITFNGGGPSTQLNRVIISGDKAFNYQQFLANPQAAPLKTLDVFFDTIEAGRRAGQRPCIAAAGRYDVDNRHHGLDDFGDRWHVAVGD